MSIGDFPESLSQAMLVGRFGIAPQSGGQPASQPASTCPAHVRRMSSTCQAHVKRMSSACQAHVKRMSGTRRASISHGFFVSILVIILIINLAFMECYY